jgi:phage terminase small subunit
VSDSIGVTVEDGERDLRGEYEIARRACTPKQRKWLAKMSELAGQKWAACNALGFSKHTVWKWLREDRIKQVLELQTQLAGLDHDITRDRIMREYERLAFSNINDFRAPDGTRKAFANWTDDMSAAVLECDFDSNGYPTHVKLHSKRDALDALAKIMGVLVDRHELTGPNGQPLQTAPPVIHIVERADSD